QVITTEYDYDPMDRRNAVREAVGTDDRRLTTMLYDAAGNLRSMTTGQSPGNPDPNYAHPIRTDYDYDELNRRKSMTEAANSAADLRLTTMMYDAADNLLSQTTGQSPGNPDPNYAHVIRTDYAYDKLDRRTAMTDAANSARDSRLTTMMYDAAGN